jgi:hypothetical protein
VAAYLDLIPLWSMVETRVHHACLGRIRDFQMPRAASPPYGKYARDCTIIFEVSGLVFIYVNELTVS